MDPHSVLCKVDETGTTHSISRVPNVGAHQASGARPSAGGGVLAATLGIDRKIGIRL